MYAHQKLVLDKRRPKKDNVFPVKVRVTHNRTQKYYPVGIDLTEADFERVNNNSVRKELRTAKNKMLSFQTKIDKIINAMDVFSFGELDIEVSKKADPVANRENVYGLFEEVIGRLRSEGRIGSASAYNDARNSLKKFKPRLVFAQVTVPFLKAYDAKLKSEGKSISTIGIYLRHLRAVYNRAVEAGIIEQKHYPFGKNKYQIKAPRNIKKALTLEQVKKVLDYGVEEGTNQQLARDMWAFSYFCNGMNIKDILNLRFKNVMGDTIQYDRSKTSNTVQNPKPILVNLLPQAVKVMDRWADKNRRENNYVFPVLKDFMDDAQKQKAKDQFVHVINHHMKKIGEAIGFDKPLTTYTARHSFATVLKRSGAPMELISESLGHKSLQTTEAYLDSFEDSTRKKYMENLVPK